MSGSEKKPDASEKKKSSWRVKSFVWATHVLLAASLGGLAVHYTVRDEWSVLAPVFYFFPPAAAFLFALPSLAIAMRKRAKLRLSLSTLAVCAAAVAVWQWDYRPTSAAEAINTGGPRTRVVAWNLADAFWGVETAGDGVEALAPDVAVLFEAPTPDESREIFGRRFPRCVVAPFSEDGLVIVKGSIADVYKKTLEGGSVALIEIDVEHGYLALAIIDLSPTSLTSREEDLKAARAAIERWHGRGREPIVLVASVHMPRNSVLLDRHLGGLGLRETFLAAGSGLGTGWPSWLPVYHGEQFWISPELSIGRSSAEWSLRSDHLPWVLEVSRR